MPVSKYGPDYYEANGRLGPSQYCRENLHWLQFFGAIADELIRQLNPRTVLDVGCAKGFLVESLRDRGVEAWGFDVSDYAISEVRPDIRPFCWVGTPKTSISKDYDLITCIEVCEHLTQPEAEEAIRQMTMHADTILFSSTPSDFNEPTHINVHPVIDWLRLFAQFSFSPDDTLDPVFVSPHALLLRRTHVQPSDRSLCQFASVKNQIIAKAETNLAAASTLQRELHAIRSSKGWKLLNFYRDLRDRAKYPLDRLKELSDRHLSYEHWIKYVEQRHYDAGRIATAITNFQYQPKISVITPVYNTRIDILESTIRSVRMQHYENWELCVCDDASPNEDVRHCLESWAMKDDRIKVTFFDRNEGICRASNRALELATGEFVGLLDHDDELSPDALYEVVKLLQEDPQVDMIYSDEDKLDSNGRRVTPFFKPDWSPEYMLACMYTCHFGVYRRRILEDLGGFRTGFDGSQDYDLVLRLSERTKGIRHIPKVLYHWRMVKGSAATIPGAKPYADEAARKALTEHLLRRQIPGEILSGEAPGSYRIRFHLGDVGTVSIIVISTGEGDILRECINSIEKKTSYPNYEIVVVQAQRIESVVRQYLLSTSCRVLAFDGGQNRSRMINSAARLATGTYLVLLHDDTEVIAKDWITSMLGFCRQEEIGVVGAKLIYRNEQIQHAGIVLGLKGMAGYPLRNLSRKATSHLRNYSVVSGACMMTRKNVFDALGGFDEELGAESSDIDFCLKARKAGYRIVWTPWAELYHDDFPSRDRKNPQEAELLKKRWGSAITNDPYYNPNLTLRHEDLGYKTR
jgi:GT2 family glycosyltransferase